MGKTNKKVLIYSPYWQTYGGGERYLLQIAVALNEKYQVFILADKILKKKAWEIFGMKLEGIEFLSPKLFSGQKFYSRYLYLRRFDIVFYMTDGSLFFPGAKKNFLIIQSPSHIPTLSMPTRFKIFGWNIICYSQFMQKIIKNRLDRDAAILAPAVDVLKFKSFGKKEKIFLSVGRFFRSSLHEKKPDFLIHFFRRFYKEHFKNWKLILVGNLTEKSGREQLRFLKKTVKDLPVTIKVNLPFRQLQEIYQKASIYWHAAGVGRNPLKFPEKMEHFGITTLEAMASGCIPVVFAAGGQLDIVQNNVNGLFWQNEDSFLKANHNLLENPDLMAAMSLAAVKRARDFSFDNFKKKLYELV